MVRSGQVRSDQSDHFVTDSQSVYDISLGAFAASELDVVFSGYQPR
jgi:hypothetical protein